MDVSNASGYDGSTVAADACFVAKHTSDRSKVVLAETLNPQVRQVVKTYALGFGLEVVEVPHRGGTTDPDELGAAAADAAAVIFQQPNFFGCLEPAPDLAAAAASAGAHPIAHVDLMSLGVLEAPGEYGCAMAIGEGQSAGCPPLYGGPHYGFFAARQEFVRRMPGRIVGETVDAGRAARVRPHAPDPRAAHPPREGDLEHHDEPDAARARRARDALVARPAGAAGGGGDVRRSRRVRARAAPARARVRARRPFKEVAFRTPIPGAGASSAACASAACTRATRSAATTRAWTTCCSSRVTEKRTPDDVDRLAQTLEEVLADRARTRLARRAADLRAVPAGSTCRTRAGLRPAEARAAARASPRVVLRASPSSPSPSSFATSRPSRTARSASTRASTRSAPAR